MVEREHRELARRLTDRGIDVDAVEARLRAQEIETPSWAYGGQGTRFAMFLQPGLPRNVFEKFDDAAVVHRLTGVCPSVAIHIPWDTVEDYGVLSAYAAEQGLRIGSINPNLFQDQEYRLGSICHVDAAVRSRACAHLLDCVKIAHVAGSPTLSLWVPDGTNYPGQDSLAERRARMLDCLRRVYAETQRYDLDVLVEYKLFEPAFYHTDLADWGSALLICIQLGSRAKVLVDLGHHAHGVNIEQIVSLLLSEGRLGGFHFNGRRYADDDLVAGTTNPLELFLIHVELAVADTAGLVKQGLDQSNNIEQKIEAIIDSVLNLQEAYAKALIVDQLALRAAQAEGDVLGAHRILMDAFRTDVRPLCAKVRRDIGAAADPIAEFRRSGYRELVVESRASGVPATWR